MIYHLEHKTLTRYAGNYDYFLKIYEVRKEQRLIQYKEQQNEIAKLEDYIRKIRQELLLQNKLNQEKKLDKIEK